MQDNLEKVISQSDRTSSRQLSNHTVSPSNSIRTPLNIQTRGQKSEWWNQSLESYTNDVFGNVPTANIFSSKFPAMRSNPTPESLKRDLQGDLSKRPKRISTKEAYEKAIAAGKVYTSPINSKLYPMSPPASEEELKRSRSQQIRNKRQNRSQKNQSLSGKAISEQRQKALVDMPNSSHGNRLAANSTYGGCLFTLKSTSVHTLVNHAMKRPHHPLLFAPLMLPNQCLISISSEETVAKAIQIMRDNNVRALAVFGSETMIEPDVNEFIERMVFKGILSVIDLVSVLCSNLKVSFIPENSGINPNRIRPSEGKDVVSFSLIKIEDIFDSKNHQSNISNPIRFQKILRRGSHTHSDATHFTSSEVSLSSKLRLSDADDSILELIDQFERFGIRSTSGHWMCVKERNPVSRKGPHRMSVNSVKSSRNPSPSPSGYSTRRSSFNATASVSSTNFRSASPHTFGQLPDTFRPISENGWDINSSYRSRSRTNSGVWTSPSLPSEMPNLEKWTPGPFENQTLDSYVSKMEITKNPATDFAECLRMVSLSDIVWFAYLNRTQFSEVFSATCKDVMTWTIEEQKKTKGLVEKETDELSHLSLLSISTVDASADKLYPKDLEDEDVYKIMKKFDLPALSVPAVYEDIPTWACFYILHAWGNVSAVAVVDRANMMLIEHLCLSDIRFLVESEDEDDINFSYSESELFSHSSTSNESAWWSSTLSGTNLVSIDNGTKRGSSREMFGFDEDSENIRSVIENTQSLSEIDPFESGLESINEYRTSFSFSELLQLPVSLFISRIRGTSDPQAEAAADKLEPKTCSSPREDENILNDTHSHLLKHRASFSSAYSESFQSVSQFSMSGTELNFTPHPEPIFISSPHDTLESAVEKMFMNSCHRVWIVDKKRHPIGIIESTDIVAALVHKSHKSDKYLTSSEAFVAATAGGVGSRGSVIEKETFSSGSEDFELEEK
ncbi:hypothetical protein HK096_001066 [Nowakowskiella sp. JEL0078]|nr:hypothetical protein HK096_001066 [Nowakowskiella sp. JEL0078]